MKTVEFRPEHRSEDIWTIRVYTDDKPGPWVSFCDPGARRVCTVSMDIGWSGAKSQAEAGAKELNEMYAEGRIE